MVFVVSDDTEARASVATLAQEVCFSAVEASPLSNARYLEPLTELQIQLAHGLGHGTRIGFQLAGLATK